MIKYKGTVAEFYRDQREESAQLWRSFRRLVLSYALGFVTCLLLLG